MSIPESCISGYTVYESDTFKCKRCGTIFKFNTTRLIEYVSRYRRGADLSTYRKYNYITETEETGVI